MPYESLFYTKENIIGYTGNISLFPTVYFRKGNRFGRITQQHSNPDNIGRNVVRIYEDYSLYNTADSGKGVEFYNGKVRHRSRNPFVSAIGLTDVELNTLASSIERFPHLKTKYRNP